MEIIKKVVLCGGGTGGHVFPAIAVSEDLKEHGCDLYYLGVNGKIEEKLAEQNGIDFYGYNFSGFPRSLKKELITWPFHLLKAVNKAKVYLKHFKPDLVFGTGGYSSAPVFIAARRLKIPYIVHNLDVRMGLANKLAANGAALLTLGFNPTEEINTKYIVTGNPIRNSFLKIQTQNKLEIYKKYNLDPNKKTIFVIGGSQGAHAINEVMIDICKDLVIENNLQVIHQTGEAKHDVFKKRIPSKILDSGSYIAKSFFENPEECYFISDLIISRAGAMTTTEIMIMGKPAIFIPYPFAGNHQEANALHLVHAQSARVINQSNLDHRSLLNAILKMISDSKNLASMGEVTKSFGKPDATKKIAEIILNIIETSSQKNPRRKSKELSNKI